MSATDSPSADQLVERVIVRRDVRLLSAAARAGHRLPPTASTLLAGLASDGLAHRTPTSTGTSSSTSTTTPAHRSTASIRHRRWIPPSCARRCWRC